MRNTLIAAILTVAVPAGLASAQVRPDFSGTWSLSPDAPLLPGGKPAAAPGFGPTINIRQDATAITISRILGGHTVHVRHPLDGSESRSRTPGRLCQGDAQSVWTAAWQDDAIATTLVGSQPPGAAAITPMDVKTLLRLQAPDTIAIETTFRNPGMTEPRTITTRYRKTGPPDTGEGEPAAPLQARISQIEWLGGTWIGTTGTSTFEERWTPPAGGSMLSVSRSIRNGIMNAFEFLCIVERSGGLVYQANEYEADMFGLNAARQPDGFAEAALLLGEYRKLEPSALEESIFFDHPSGRTRIHAAMRWKANQNSPGAMPSSVSGGYTRR